MNTEKSLSHVNFYMPSAVSSWLFNRFGGKDVYKISFGDNDNYSFDIINQPFHCEVKVNDGDVAVLLYIRMDYGIYQEEHANIHIIFHANGDKPSLVSQSGIGGDATQTSSYFLKVAFQLREQVSNSFYDSIVDLDPEKEGVLVSLSDDELRFERVSGKKRPSMLCNNIFEGMHMARPYMDEQMGGLMREMMSMDVKLAGAEDGDEDCMEEVALAYLKGNEEVEQDFAKSAYWWEKLAETGNSKAQFNIGMYYAKGCGVTRDFGKAAEWMKMAVDNGDTDAEALLTICSKAAENLKKAESGDAEAQAKMAKVFTQMGAVLDQYGTDEDYKAAFKWAEKSAQQGNPEGLYCLALCYEHGRGIDENIYKAIDAYKKGAEAGHDGCQYNLGCQYMTGNGVEKDRHKAFELIKSAAEKGNGLAMRELGRCYQFARGTSGNMKTAVEWYEKALEVINDPELAQKTAVFKNMTEWDPSFVEEYPEDESDDTDDKRIEDATELIRKGLEKSGKPYDDETVENLSVDEACEALAAGMEDSSDDGEEARKAGEEEARLREQAQRKKREDKEKKQQEENKRDEEVRKRVDQKEKLIMTFANVVCSKLINDNQMIIQEQELAKKEAEEKLASLGFFKRSQKQEQRTIIETCQRTIDNAKSTNINLDIIRIIGANMAEDLAEEDRKYQAALVDQMVTGENRASKSKSVLLTSIQKENEEAKKTIIDILKRSRKPMTEEEIANSNRLLSSFTNRRIINALGELKTEGLVRSARDSNSHKLVYATRDKPDFDLNLPTYDVMDVDLEDGEAVKEAVRMDLDFLLRQWKYDSRELLGTYAQDINQNDIVDTCQMRLDILRFYKLHEGQNLQTLKSAAGKSLKDNRGGIRVLSSACENDLVEKKYLVPFYRKNDIVTSSITDKGKLLLALDSVFYES